MWYMIFGGAMFVVAVGLVGVKFWLDERSEKRWHKMVYDLINRKMAKDFYDYVNGSEIINNAKNPQLKMLEDIEQQIRDRQDAGNVPRFINQEKAPIPLKSNREY